MNIHEKREAGVGVFSFLICFKIPEICFKMSDSIWLPRIYKKPSLFTGVRELHPIEVMNIIPKKSRKSTPPHHAYP